MKGFEDAPTRATSGATSYLHGRITKHRPTPTGLDHHRSTRERSGLETILRSADLTASGRHVNGRGLPHPLTDPRR